MVATVKTQSARRSNQRVRQERFLKAFKETGDIGRAAKCARIHRQSHYDWLKNLSSYDKRFSHAREQAAQALEDEAVNRALHGIKNIYCIKVNNSKSTANPISKIFGLMVSWFAC